MPHQQLQAVTCDCVAGVQNLEEPKGKFGTYQKPPDAQRCRAQSKQRKDRCKKWAAIGKTLCKFHGAKSEGVPNLAGSTTLEHTQFVRKSQLPEIVARMRDLDTKDGKSEFIKLRTALTEQVADNLAPMLEKLKHGDDTALELALKVEDRLAKNVALLHEMEAEQVASVPTTFNIVQYTADGPFRRVLARGLDGAITIQYIENQPFMFDPQLNAYFAAVRQVDDDSGAEFFTRLLEAAPSE